MFNSLSNQLDKAFHVLKGHGKITEINVAETTKEIRRALLNADVNFKIAKEFTKRVKDKALGQEVLTSLKPGQLLTKIVKDELTELMGGSSDPINISKNTLCYSNGGIARIGKNHFFRKIGKLLTYQKIQKTLIGCL
jgi:signal recognition particle subunit SRP54